MEGAMQIERREVPGLEVRADNEAGTVVIAGRGVPYGEWSEDLGGFREQFAVGALRATLADDDIRALFNHDSNLVLGRKSNGTLRLREDGAGVHYEVDVNPEDTEAMSAVARIRRGDITGNSFGFYIERGEDQEWEERDGMLWRTVRRARLRELGPQTFPAYPQSDVSVRSLLEDARKWLESRGRSTEVTRQLLRLQDQDVGLYI